MERPRKPAKPHAATAPAERRSSAQPRRDPPPGAEPPRKPESERRADPPRRDERAADRDRLRDDRSGERSHPRDEPPVERDRPRDERTGERDRPRDERTGERDRPRDERPADRDRAPSGAPPAGHENPNRENRPREDWRKPDKRRGSARRGGRRRRRNRHREGDANQPNAPRPDVAAAGGAQGSAQGAPAASAVATDDPPLPAREAFAHPAEANAAAIAPPTERHGPAKHEERRDQRHGQRPQQQGRPAHANEPRLPVEDGGMLVKEMGGFGVLRRLENQFLPSREDIFVPQRLIQMHRLRDGSIVRGRIGRGQKHKYALNDVSTVDGKPPDETKNLADFKSLVTIDPDFHYAVGDATGDVSMRILDIICPVGRGQRGLIVAPPRAGKTTILRQFAKGIEVGYPDVDLMVLLVDERPEEATEWKRCTKGQVFVSTADETAKTHVQLAEAVWKRAMRLVELGHDVVLLLDSITRLARAYNNLAGGSGRTMSGGLDSQAMQKPRQFFGSARNTEKAGSLTILGTTLVETGSRMDQLIFEEFKGTGNMELVLSRKLADRRIFPAIDIEKSGTRKEEKLYSAKRLKHIAILRRVLLRMNFIEAMELLVTKLDDVETNDEFLKRFEVDPEA
jgi:transcription termination factor Rho